MTEKRKCGCSKPAAVSSIIPDTSPTNKIIINTEKAPLPLGPYSQGVKIDKTIYVSGILGILVDGGTLIEGGAAPQARLALKHLGTILAEGGSSYNNVLKTTIYLSNIEDFPAINDQYKLFFPKDYPARTTVQVACLPMCAQVEIDAIATVIETAAAPPAKPPGGGEEPPADAPPAAAASQPVVAASQPSVAASQPAIATSQPAVTSSQPAVATSQPAVATSQPAVAAAEEPAVLAAEEPAEPAAGESQAAVAAAEEAPAEEEAPPAAEEPPAEEAPAEEAAE